MTDPIVSMMIEAGSDEWINDQEMDEIGDSNYNDNNSISNNSVVVDVAKTMDEPQDCICAVS